METIASQAGHGFGAMLRGDGLSGEYAGAPGKLLRMVCVIGGA
jgi:hypothetical protein